MQALDKSLAGKWLAELKSLVRLEFYEDVGQKERKETTPPKWKLFYDCAVPAICDRSLGVKNIRSTIFDVSWPQTCDRRQRIQLISLGMRCSGYTLVSLFHCSLPSILKSDDSFVETRPGYDPWQKFQSESSDIQWRSHQQEPTAYNWDGVHID